jgi:predicted ribosomally synthesized peptide with SipW-like signal peptide
MEKEFERENKEQKKKKHGLLLIGKKRKQRLLIMLVMLLVTGIMLGTSTYAWFTSNKTVNVNDITVNVAAQNGIQISVDGTTWKSIIQTTDITGASAKYAAAVNQLPTTMEPVSSALVMDSTGKMEMFYGTVDNNAAGNPILVATKDTEQNGTTGKFVAFDLFFKVDAAFDKLYMNGGSGVKADGTDVGIKNASRIAFAVLGNTASGSDLATIQALNAGAASPVYMWEPNFDVHTATGITHAKDTYDIDTGETDNRLAYNGVKAEISKENNQLLNSDDSNYFAAVTPTYSTTAANTNAFEIFGLSAGITKVRIYMWIEGQDVDCENNASGGNITYNLQITTEAPEGV